MQKLSRDARDGKVSDTIDPPPQHNKRDTNGDSSMIVAFEVGHV
jgi:hypothetical protein